MFGLNTLGVVATLCRAQELLPLASAKFNLARVQ